MNDPAMWTVEPNFKVIIGGMTFIDTPNLIAYRGEPLLRLYRKPDGCLGIDFDVHDVQGKKMLLARMRRSATRGRGPLFEPLFTLRTWKCDHIG